MVEHRHDCIGETMRVGDVVTYAQMKYAGLNFFEVVSFTPKMVRLRWVGHKTSTTITEPSRCLVLSDKQRRLVESKGRSRT